MQPTPRDVEHAATIVAVKMVVVMISASTRLISIRQAGKRDWDQRALVNQRFKGSIDSSQAYRMELGPSLFEDLYRAKGSLRLFKKSLYHRSLFRLPFHILNA